MMNNYSIYEPKSSPRALKQELRDVCIGFEALENKTLGEILQLGIVCENRFCCVLEKSKHKKYIKLKEISQ